MACPTFMVNLELGRSNASLLGAAERLADRFDAAILGIAAGQVAPVVYNEAFVTGEMIGADRRAVQSELDAARSEFTSRLGGHRGGAEWREAVTLLSPADYVAREARGVDAVLASSGPDANRFVQRGELVMESGRPVLSIPANLEALELGHVVVAWKDTREARRAVLLSLPFLEVADRVSVIGIAAADTVDEAKRQVDDVVGWLARHDVRAEGWAREERAGAWLDMEVVVAEQHADLVVSGAYGHSRLREWVLGGFTRGLLASARHCSMVAH